MLEPSQQQPLYPEYVDDWMYERTGGVVQTGPFQGVKLLRKTTWRETRLAPMLLGCYEQELHNVIERELRYLSVMEFPRVLNLGCAEGYYAVGFAYRFKRHKSATVFAVDVNQSSLELTTETAAANGVVVNTTGDMDECGKADFIFSDCEGGEYDYLDPHRRSYLRDSSILVECHNSEQRSNTMILKERFEESHHLSIIREGSRDPNDFDLLHREHSLFRWMAMNEGRPCVMHWMYMQPKERT